MTIQYNKSDHVITMQLSFEQRNIINDLVALRTNRQKVLSKERVA